jgi:uncharacterized membrane protein
MSLSPFLDASLVIQLHIISATSALVLGAFVLFRRKGTPVHKKLGWLWCALMLVTAGSAIFINEIQLVGPFSPIHLFSLLTFYGLVQGIRAIRRRDVKAHRAAMQGLYFLALMLAGTFTLLPGRRMHAMLFGADAGWPPSLVAIALALTASGAIYLRLRRRPL